MIHRVLFNDENGNPRYGVIFDTDETLTEKEIIEEAADHLEIDMPDNMASVKIDRAADSNETGDIWLRFHDGIVVPESFFGEDDDL